MSNLEIDFGLLFDQISAPCAILDDQLRFVEANQLYLKTLLRTRDELIGVSVLEAFPETPERQALIEDLFRRALQGEANTLSEIVYRIPELADENRMREIWWSVHSSPIPDANGHIRHFALRVEDVTEEVKTRHLKDMIAGELQHRVSNLLSLVTTIARRTAYHSEDMAQFIADFEARIGSLARTHSLLTGGNWDGMTMERLVMKQLEAYVDRDNDHMAVSGPDLRLSALEAQSMSMALHELATNSAKYGALKELHGKLRITWKIDGNGYEVDWFEHGLKDIQAPKREGFGSMILTKFLPSQLNGRVVREFTPSSHRYRLVVESRQSGPSPAPEHTI